MSKITRYTSLDSLRGIAALTVVFGHFLGAFGSLVPAWKNLSDSLWSVAWDAGSAVILFFVLSGFVLALPYLNGGKKMNYKEFMVRRVFRLVPVAIFSLLLAVFCKAFLFSRSGLSDLGYWMNSLWTLNFSTHIHLLSRYLLDLNPPMWSLIVEFVASLTIPFVILILSRTTLLGSFLVLFGSFISAFFSNPVINTFWENHVLFFFGSILLKFMPFFIIGCILAKYKNQLVFRFSRLKKEHYVLLMTLSLFLYESQIYLLPRGWDGSIIMYVSGFGSAIFILLVLANESLGRFLSKHFSFLGDVSYALYLTHFTILISVTSLLYPLTKSFILCIFVTLFLSFSLSSFIRKKIELPFVVLGRNISSNGKSISYK